MAHVDGDAVAAEAIVDNAIRDGVDALCDAISSKYSAFLDRRPTLRELLESLEFVLGHHAERFLAVAEDAVRTLHRETAGIGGLDH